MKQKTLFKEEEKGELKYTRSVSSPIYEPRGISPSIFELCDTSKSARLIRKISASNLDHNEKEFLTRAAFRHNVFHYEKIADYYANTSKEMQTLMEESALVIIDFEKAIEFGYVRLSKELKKQYLNDYD